MHATDSTPRVLVLNGGSSSGKTSLARVLQRTLPGSWLRFGVDDLVEACPPAMSTDDGLHIADDGVVSAGPAFQEAERHWMAGIARMAELGALIIVEDNFVSGPSAQARWRSALRGVHVGWVGVLCAPEVAQERERRRGDRAFGMAAHQATRVHAGIDYDLRVDSGAHSIDRNADLIRQRFFRAG
ncbi:MAG TPA: zeta toxin family protein [Jatrophihabitans sp.]|nr:zeta toxin family protein [Jatrophihabitans sp.]